ncbi:MAG TPA: YicC/YloC family endoribonuclease [Clostridia bacterium]|nr:YicC/YloC family endoribonuclease [Clostridia bacterium]
MSIRSMTGFAQVKGQHGGISFTITLKSVNHRFLDLHLRLPSNSDALEQKIRRVFKEHLHRGHIELTLSIERTDTGAVTINRELVSGYIQAYRKAAGEFGISGEPDLNAILRLNGALSSSGEVSEDEGLQSALLVTVEEGIARLNEMRTHEGDGAARELRERMHHLGHSTAEVEQMRGAVLRAYLEKVQSRMQELLGANADPERVLQEAAMLAERSDIQEEIVRMKTHIQHFLGLLDEGGEVGKKLDFLLQEMNREANTLLSKTSGVAGEALRITEMGLAMKSEIEKSREQVQNIE